MMTPNFTTIFGLLLALVGTAIAGVVPAAVVAAPAAIGYAGVVPYNVPPYASRVDISTKTLAAPIVAHAPLVAAAAPIVAAHPYQLAPAAHLTYGSLIAPPAAVIA